MVRSDFAEVAARATRRRDDKRGISSKNVRRVAEKSSNFGFRVKDLAMTLAQQFHQDGRQEGWQEGRWIGKIQTLEEFLNLPVSWYETLDALSLAELEAIHQRLHADYEVRFKRS